MKSQYPILPSQPTPQDVENWIRDVTRLRQLEDLGDYTNLPNIFMRGRLVGKIPSASTNIEAADSLGDFSFAADGSFLYIVVSVSGTLTWARVALTTSW